ncbi:MAG: F0F1 ATP synthase subunit A [Actinomycetales bacterium]|nr:F0F1 ATP synthase subunit A [Actinomycetales bacterium]
MDMTQLSPDEVILWQRGFVTINATIAFTWVLMAVLIVASWLVTRRLTSSTDIPKGQNALEAVVEFLRDEISEVTGGDRPTAYLPFVGTLFLFIAVANLLAIIPGYLPPTASLSTTAALALAVFLAVPGYAVARQGPRAFLRRYVEPSPIMLPFTVLGDITRSLALAVRLFGNMMSSAKIVAILLVVVPFIFPVLFQALGLVFGMIQAYIFAVLAIVYIASGMTVTQKSASGAEGRTPEAATDTTESSGKEQ